MKYQLFKEFPEVSAKQWRQQIEADLKGADFEKLMYKSPDGIELQPFYTSEDYKGNTQLPLPAPWKICERIIVNSAEEANKKAWEVLEKGAESLWLKVSSENICPNALFEGIDLEHIPVYLHLNFLSVDYIEKVSDYLKGKNAQVYLQTDVIGRLAQTGNFFFEQQKDFQVLKSISEVSEFKSVISIDLSLYHNAGASIPQQLGYALSQLKEYVKQLFLKGQKQEEFPPQFIVSCGSNYFFEMAKLRALRQLYRSFARKYGLSEHCFILALPTKRDKTLYDYNVNLLRTTTQCMSAIIGGANAVTNLPYDVLFKKESELGERIARNQLLIMKNEAYLNKVANPADGAYYIEELTRQFTEAALEIFRKIKNEGGFLKLLLKGEIQQQIADSAQKEQALFDKGELILVGTNKFPNLQDRMQYELELDPFFSQTPRNTLIEPIMEKRLSKEMEQQRLQQEPIES